MRRLFLAGILTAAAATSATGCFLNAYTAEPIRRYQQLLFQSEDLRLLRDDYERFWMLDRPSALSLKRYHGLARPYGPRYPN